MKLGWYKNSYRRSLLSNAPKRVELVEYDLGERVQINVVDLLALTEKLTLPTYKVSVKMKEEPKSLINVTNGKELPFSYKDGMATFSVRSFNLYEMYELCC